MRDLRVPLILCLAAAAACGEAPATEQTSPELKRENAELRERLAKLEEEQSSSSTDAAEAVASVLDSAAPPVTYGTAIRCAVLASRVAGAEALKGRATSLAFDLSSTMDPRPDVNQEITNTVYNEWLTGNQLSPSAAQAELERVCSRI